MATTARGRPSRRAASRRTSYIEDVSEEEDLGNVTPTPSHSDAHVDTEDNDDTPVAPKRLPRRGGRRKASEAPLQPSLRSTRNKRATRSIDPDTSVQESSLGVESYTVEETVEQEAEDDGEDKTVLAAQEEPESPSEKIHAAQKRKRPASSRKSRDSATPAAELSSLPTPSPSASPEASSRSHREFNSPLSDITQSAVNKSPAPTRSDAEEPKSQISIINSQSTTLEKPMDIVVKSRALGIPVVDEPKTPRARMVITRLVLTNFKSYAGKQIVGPFHVSFSSVVGPNGSGKSNVIDSLLFVFGFRASKMRQGKISALIHNSAQFPDLNFCEVEVHFQEVMDLPGGAHKVVPDSQLVVSRKAFKNNSSKYYMNKTETNFTTVTTFLKDRGIDLDHKRFLILQGEVESIAQMKPKAGNEHEDGLLEYLEDIIGTSKYKIPIEEAAAEVETLNDVCVEKNNRVQHVEKEKSALEEKKNKALAYIRDENDLTMKQSALYQIYIAECENNTKVTEEAIMQMQELLNMELEKHEGNESGIKEIEREYKRATKEYESMEKAAQLMIKEMAKHDKENVKFEEKRKFLSGKLKKLEKTLQSSRLASSESSSMVEKFTSDIEKKSEEIAQLEEEMKSEETELASIRDSLKGKTQGLSDQIAAKQKSLEPWNAKINDKLSAIAVAQSELDILTERGNAGTKALEEAQARISNIEDSLAEKEEELEAKHEEKAQLITEVESLKKDINKLSQKEPELRSLVSSARQKAEEARSSLASTQNKGSVLSGLMRLKESGRIDGFHGRLGNLGTIEEKYDVAISTACPQLENMVVDTVEAGQQCIDYLRKNNLGRANFILLDRLPKRDMSTIYTPESVPRLFDLVKPKESKFAAAFYSVLQNTLVAKDLEQANRIAYGAKRWRVVTLDGQLIDLSGTMSGGGTRVAKGGMSSKQVAETSKEQVSKLEYDRDELEKKLRLFQDKQRQLETSLREKTDEIPKLDTKIQKIAIEIESGKRSLADAQRRIKELSVEHKPSKQDESRARSLEQQIQTLQQEIEEVRQDMAGIEEEIQSLQSKIMEVGGVRLRSQKAKVDGLKSQINLLSEEISNAEVAKSKNEKLIKKHEKSRAEAELEIEQLNAEIDQLNEDVKNQANDASGSRQKAEDAQEALETKRGEIKALKQELDQKTAELNETRAQEIEMRNKLEENQKILTENQKRSRYWEEKLSKLSLQNVSDLGDDQEPAELQTFTVDELGDMNKESLKAVIAALEEKTQNASVDLSVIDEYRRRVAEHETRSADLNESLTNRDAVKNRLDSLRSARLTGFMEGFSTISLRLKEMYQMITMGGNAELELVDSLDPFSEGILFSVMPPKKSWKNISNLSGGEKTLSSLALVFALHHYKPTPLYVMDEIDAALDFRNVSIVASYIKERTKNAQFIVISLRNNMFELASRLIGVYKVNHMTKSVTVENRDYITGRSGPSPTGPSQS